MAITYRLETQLSPGIWTDVSSELQAVAGMSFGRGIRGNRPTDCVATPGPLAFTVRSAAGILGYYSPFHANVRAGWTFGIPVRVVFVKDTIEYIRWTGVIREIIPDPGQFKTHRVLVVAHDIMSSISDSEVREVAPQIGATEVELLNVAMDSLPAEAQPLARDFDPAVATFAYAFHDLGSGQFGLTVLQKVCLSAQGFSFPNGAGTLRYQSRQSRQLSSPVFTFNNSMHGLTVPTDLANVYNRVRLVFRPKLTPGVTVVLWKHDGSIAIPAGGTVERWGTYRNPDNDKQLIGGYDFEDPLVSGTDYAGFANEDGTGANLTADLSVTVEPFASTVKATIENNGASLVYIPSEVLQLRGKPVYDRSPVGVESFTAETYGNRPITIELPYRDDDGQVQDDADYLQANYRSLTHQIGSLEFLTLGDDDFEQQACDLEIGDVIAITEPVTGVDVVTVFVQSIDWIINSNGVLRVRLGLAPRIIRDEVADDTVYVHDRLYMASGLPDDMIGFMRFGFSEIGA